MASDTLRTICIAYKDLSGGEDRQTKDKVIIINYTFLLPIFYFIYKIFSYYSQEYMIQKLEI